MEYLKDAIKILLEGLWSSLKLFIQIIFVCLFFLTPVWPPIFFILMGILAVQAIIQDYIMSNGLRINLGFYKIEIEKFDSKKYCEEAGIRYIEPKDEKEP